MSEMQPSYFTAPVIHSDGRIIDHVFKTREEAEAACREFEAKLETVIPRDLYTYVRELERKAKERDALYWHCKALLELLLSLKTAPIATYAAAYLTQIVPPKDKP